MPSSNTAENVVTAKRVQVSDTHLRVELSDGRALSVPLDWFPRLAEGQAKERSAHEFIGEGIGIHWPLLDEDISIEGLLAGRRSMESKASLQRWRSGRS